MALEVNENLNIQREMDAFVRVLKENSMKVTNQRMVVAECIFRTHAHFTADDLTDFLKNRYKSVSKATVYRILSILVDAGLIDEHDFGQSQKFYEHSLGHEHHDHLICTRCGKIIEFMDPDIEKLQVAAARRYNFQVTDHTLNIYGLCAPCGQKTNGKSGS